jgi:glyoxylase-like metal-dependent hydrolase (beta-lactamase superfamily II)
MINSNSIRNFHEIYPSIYRLSLPMPGKKPGPGPVNVYLFTGKHPALLDTGTSGTAGDLLGALGKMGLDAGGLGKIVFSHGHLDHCGAARALLGALPVRPDTVAHRDDAGAIARGYDTPLRDIMCFLRAMGLPPGQRLRMMFLMSRGRLAFRGCPVSMTVTDGDVLQMGDYKARVIATPGHSRGSMCLHIESEGLLFSGDTVIPHITPNPLVMLETEGGMPARKSQEEFHESLSRLEKLNPRLVFPGHGRPVEELEKVTALYRKHYGLRDRKILSALEKKDLSVYRIARALFPKSLLKKGRLILEIYLAVSEVYTHLQVLEEQGLVAMTMRKNKLTVSLKKGLLPRL